MTTDGLDIPSSLDRRSVKAGKPTVYTYTMLNAYLNCPEAMNQRYIAKTLPYVETAAMKHGNNVHTAMEHRVGLGKMLPADMQKWEPFATPFDGKGAVTEQKLGMTNQGQKADYWNPPVWFRGKVDVALIKQDKAFITDWKSGKSSYEDPFELQTNALLLKANHPALTRIVGTYAYLGEDKVSEVYDLSNFAQTWTRINAIIREIEQSRADNDWLKKRSGLCGYCDYLACENNTKANRK